MSLVLCLAQGKLERPEMPPPFEPKATVIVAVYDPPRPGLPYLVAVIDECGKVSAVGFETDEEADAYAGQTADTLVAALTESESV
jgi:hypothetical protein